MFSILKARTEGGGMFHRFRNSLNGHPRGLAIGAVGAPSARISPSSRF